MWLVRPPTEGRTMTIPPELIAALSARDAGRFAAAASLLRPLAESGHVEAQAHLGSVMMLGLHRFATQAEATAWDLTARAAERGARQRDSKGDVEQARRWLQNASDHGIGPASHNLASAYLAGGGDLPPAERLAKVKELLDKARDQGFAFFAGEPGDERYLQTLAEYAASNGIGMPWEKRPEGEPGAAG